MIRPRDREEARMATSSIAFTMYPVTDLPRAVTFYRDGLGLATTDVQSDYWVEFDVAGATFGIGNFEQVGTPGTAQSLALEVDMEPARARLAEHGFEASEPHELQHCRISVVRDPDGNQVWLHETKPR
jgi:predicted enzyme related to lactoylglutathione lyase